MSKPSEFRGFNVVWRGYNRQQVDRYLEALSEADTPVGPPPFQIVGRGYDRQQVDARIRDLLADKGISG
ncbi:DivIVA domain-containing protein [Streptomyces sp. NPDC048434]|uniref:DivIVA domain-containing protein n=1 Tax=Streptomyces sp. NPDC048434 TaxID=3365549 RepID=UPI00371AA647